MVMMVMVMVAMVVVVWAGDRSDFVGATASRRIAIAEDARRVFILIYILMPRQRAFQPERDRYGT